MSIFDLHATVVTHYRDFVCSFFDIADPGAHAPTVSRATNFSTSWTLPT
jgi:hypothetical protein